MSKSDNKSGWQWGPDTWIAFWAMVIALVGIGLALWEGFENREHDKLSIRPRIYLSLDSLPNEGTYFRLHSMGLGPAIIKTLHVKVDGKTQNNWDSMAQALNMNKKELMSDGPTYYALTPGIPILTNTIINLFGVSKANGIISDILLKNNERISMIVCYCSFYNECWTVSNNDLEPKADKCEEPLEESLLQPILDNTGNEVMKQAVK